MGSSYLKNHLGFALTDDQFQDIPYPVSELTTHVTIKTVQAGALLGTTVLGPLYALARAPTRSLAGITQKAVRFGRNGMIIGLGLGPLVTYLQGKNFATPEFTDRDYRLRNNRGQVRVDRASVLGSAAGAGVAMVMGSSPMAGGVIGVSAGIIGMSVYNSIQSSDNQTNNPDDKSTENTAEKSGM